MRPVSRAEFRAAQQDEKPDGTPTPPVSTDRVVEILYQGQKYALDTRHCLVRGGDGAIGIMSSGAPPHFGLSPVERKLVEAIPRVKALLDAGTAKFLAPGEV